MFKALAPITLFALSAGLFFLYVRPAYEVLIAFQEQERQIDIARARSTDLKGKVDELRIALREYEREGTSVARLHALVPDAVHPVRLVIDIDALAQKHEVTLTSFTVPQVGGVANKGVTRGVPADDDDPLGVATMRVVASGSYADIKAFTEALERNLTLLDIVKFSLARGDQARRAAVSPGTVAQATNPNDLTADITLNVYWLK